MERDAKNNAIAPMVTAAAHKVDEPVKLGVRHDRAAILDRRVAGPTGGVGGGYV